MPWSQESTTNLPRSPMFCLGRHCPKDCWRIYGKAKSLAGICGLVMVLARVFIFQTFPNMVWEGMVFGAISKKRKPREKPYQEYVDLWWSWQGSSFFNFFPTWSGKESLGDHFGKSEAKRKALSGICGFVMVLARIIIFPIVPNMVWEGIVLGTILEKVKPRETPYQEYVDL